MSQTACAGIVLIALLMIPALPARLLAQESGNNAATGELRVAYTSYSRYDGGAPMPQPITFLPGDQVVLRAKIAGFRTAELSYQEYRVKLSYEVSAVDFRGMVIGKTKKGELDEPVHKEDKEWLPTLEYKFSDTAAG